MNRYFIYRVTSAGFGYALCFLRLTTIISWGQSTKYGAKLGQLFDFLYPYFSKFFGRGGVGEGVAFYIILPNNGRESVPFSVLCMAKCVGATCGRTMHVHGVTQYRK
jgi:hypothetical protein